MSLPICETKVLPKAVVNFYKDPEGSMIAQGIFEQGWCWSKHAPHEDVDRCLISHTGYCVKGEMTVYPVNGSEYVIKAGDFYHIEPGHDAVITSVEGCEMLDFVGSKILKSEWKPVKQD